jgi:hypothetical protein
MKAGGFGISPSSDFDINEAVFHLIFPLLEKIQRWFSGPPPIWT